MPSKYTKVFVSVSFLWHQCSFQYCFYDINKYNKIYDCEILSTCTKCWCYLNSWFTHVHVVVLTQLQNYNNKPFRPLTFLVVLEQVSMIEKLFLIYVDEIGESRFCFNLMAYFLCFVFVFCCFVMFLFYFCFYFVLLCFVLGGGGNFIRLAPFWSCNQYICCTNMLYE